MNQASKNISIGSVLVCLLFGIIGGLLAYTHMDYPLVYSDFIVGSLSWENTGKSRDVYMVFGFLFGASLSLLGISRLQAWFKSEYDENVSAFFSTVLIYASLPFVIWIGEQVLSKKEPNFDLLFLNAWIVLGAVLATRFVLQNNIKAEEKTSAINFIIFSFLIFSFATFSPDVLGVILKRFGEGGGLSRRILMDAWLFVPAIWLVGLYLIKNKTKYYVYSIVLFQLIIIGYFILLVPAPYITQGHLTFFPMQNTLFVVLLLVVSLSVYDIYRRFVRYTKEKELTLSILSPFPVIAILILMFFSQTTMPTVSKDDYHFGEKLLSYYMVSKHYAIPYVDYSMAHGFTDMLPALGSALFLDGTASTLYEGRRILTGVIMIVLFLITYRYIGLLAALLLSIFAIKIKLWYFIAIVMSLIIMKVKVERLGISFFLISLMMFLLSPGQGVVFIVAILPLVLYRLWSTQTISLNLKYMAISILALFVVALAMPWIAEMIYAALRYVLENSSINFQAYGISWQHSWDSAKTLNSSLMVNEIIRTSWVFIPIFLLAFWLLGYYQDKKKALFYGLFAVAFIFIMHKYSLGRIDPSGFSRLGIITNMAIMVLFLSVYFLGFSRQNFAYWVLFFAFWMGLLTPSLLGSPMVKVKQTIPNYGILTSGEDIGIASLGNGRINAAHVNRILGVKKITDRFLDENETFLDLTNRSALYFYLNRRMPIEAVPYNQPYSKMQQRSIDRLSENPPPIALLIVDNIVFEGRTVSLRAHKLYRWVMDNYIPVEIDNMIVGVHKDMVERFKSRGVSSLPNNKEDELLLWDRVFLLQDIRKLPVSWGISSQTLDKKMITVKNIESEKKATKGKLVVYDISEYNLSGSEAGLLSFNFTCNNGNKPILEIHWSADANPMTEKTVVRFNTHNGPLIVPMDAMPRWYTAKHLNQLGIGLQNQKDCKFFTIDDLKLSQRIIHAK